MFHKIVVGVDGTEGARRAVQWSAEQARDSDAEVVAVMAIRPMGEFAMSVPPLSMDTLRGVREVFRSDWCAPLREAGVPHRTEVVQDDPVHGLCAVVERERPDVLVVGAHDRGGVADRLLGSVSYAVTHRARCPVVVIPALATST
jgi:nucleotide-binding universal stress UspA family protein